MKLQNVLFAILMLTIVGVNWWNNTRPGPEFVLLPNDAVKNELLTGILSTCHYNGYIQINQYTFMCTRIGDYDVID